VKEIIEQADSQEVAEHWEKEVKALRMMNELNQEHIVRFITAFRRLRRSGFEEHYVMFEWANGGNLRNLWEKVPFPDLTGSLVKDAIKQILGLASALQAAHNLNNTEASYRHGDLKPENILIFKTGEETLGTLKIGDWGEAKYHGKDQFTEMRSKKTTARFGTRRYEAPEVVTGIKVKRQNQPEKRRSRLYDVWAMGCITLEFIVWLLYGLDGLNKFNQDVDGDTFYQTSIENGIKVARLHDAVVRWMDHMADEPACEVGNTAIGDLLDVVRGSLLVVKLPRRGGLSFMTAINEADETADVDRPRADSFIGYDAEQPTRSDLNYVMESPAVSDPRPSGVVPVLVVTGAEEDTEDPTQDIQPVQPLPELSGPARCLASTFSDKVDQIWWEDDIVGYWDTHRHHPCVPVGLASPPSLQVVDNRNGAASEDQAVSRLNLNTPCGVQLTLL
jgi:serine/threonine protein kinase